MMSYPMVVGDAGCHPPVERGHGDEPGGDDQLGPDSHRQLGADDRPDTDRQGHRQQVDTGRERPVAPDGQLEVLGHEEDEAEQREERNRDRHARRAEPHVAEEPDVEHRSADPAFPRHERGEQHAGAGEPDDAPGAAPAGRRRLDDGEDQEGHGQGRQGEAGDVDLGGGRILGRRDAQCHQHRGQGGDRAHGEEDAAPGEVLEEPAPDDRAEERWRRRHLPPTGRWRPPARVVR